MFNISLKRELETLIFICLASSMGLLVVWHLKQPKQFVPLHLVTPAPNFLSSLTPTPILSPIETGALAKTSTSWDSSDGTYILTMQEVTNLNATKVYTFTSKDVTNNREFPIVTQTVPSSTSFSIPFNAFSPDNRYVFLKKTAQDGVHFFVYNASGQSLGNGQITLDIAPLFASYTTDYMLVDVTGWASPTLLVVNAKDTSGQISSFWFDVSSNSFIPLATTFE